MELTHITFVGPPIDDAAILDLLPSKLAGLLSQVNGFIQYGGGLHVRGACAKPVWHSLRDGWHGERAFHILYPSVSPDDVPFAEDCMGDQFLLRDEHVWKLSAETGELESLGVSFGEFLRLAQSDPIEYLGMHPLLRFHNEGKQLEPGQLLAVWPPFCTKESKNGVSLAAISTDERRRFLAELAANLRDVPDGGNVTFPVTE